MLATSSFLGFFLKANQAQQNKYTPDEEKGFQAMPYGLHTQGRVLPIPLATYIQD